MWSSIPVALLLLTGFAAVSHGYKVLMTVPGISSSQVVFFYKLGELWAEAGHDVTIFRTSFMPEMNIPKMKKIKRELVMEVLTETEDQAAFRKTIGQVQWHQNVSTKSLAVMKTGLWVGKNILLDGCRMLLKNEKMMSDLKEAGPFDVMAIHAIDSCSVGLAHMMGVNSTIQISPAFLLEFMAWLSGSPWTVATVPSSVVPFPAKMNIFQRLGSWAAITVVNSVYFGILLPYSTRGFREVVDPNFPSIRSLISETQLFYINADPLLDYPRPTMPNTVYVGGFMMEDLVVKNLTAEWSAIVESPMARKHGFIIFSFGSVVNTKFMPDDIKMKFFNAFKKLPQPVIWRFVGSLPEAKGTNVHVTQWMPQADLLAHPNAAAFITHGGFNSVLEASYAGVPLVVMPFFGDQVGNVRRVERLGTGFAVDFYNLTEDGLVEAVNTVLGGTGREDEGETVDYPANARRLSRMLKNKPVSNRDNALKWMEFLAEFKTLENFQSSAKHLNIFQYFLVDLMILLGVAGGMWLVVVITCCKCCCGKVCGKTRGNETRTSGGVGKDKKRKNHKKSD